MRPAGRRVEDIAADDLEIVDEDRDDCPVADEFAGHQRQPVDPVFGPFVIRLAGIGVDLRGALGGFLVNQDFIVCLVLCQNVGTLHEAGNQNRVDRHQRQDQEKGIAGEVAPESALFLRQRHLRFRAGKVCFGFGDAFTAGDDGLFGPFQSPLCALGGKALGIGGGDFGPEGVKALLGRLQPRAFAIQCAFGGRDEVGGVRQHRTGVALLGVAEKNA